MNHHLSTPWCTTKKKKSQQATIVALKMNPEMDTSEMRVPLQEAVKIFEAGLKSKTWTSTGHPQDAPIYHNNTS